MWHRWHARSSPHEVVEVDLCEIIVKRIEEVLKRRKVLNERQCKLLALKLSVGISCIRKAMGCCEKHKPAFAPLLRALYRYYEKAEVLVRQCGDQEWGAATIFQRGNTASFEDIIEHVRYVGMVILWCSRQYACPMDICTLENTFQINFGHYVDDDEEDEEELRTRLEGLASEERNSTFRFMLQDQAHLREQHLARYLLKTDFRSKHRDSSTNVENLEMYMWKKDGEPTRTWGESKFLGAGSGASGVCKTSWLGVPCAKKEFHGEASKTIFMKEALIMASLKHPCIVDFVCCGDGKGKGDRFIAMELMEKSLFELIEERLGVPFALDVALDIILQIANGVKYLHEQGVAHRDLKPQNVVVKTLRSPYYDDYYDVKLVDFGTCKSEVEVAKSNIVSLQGVGTTRYRAPEVHPSAGSKKVEWFKADAYSFAMTCAHVLTLKQPYENSRSLSELNIEILKGERPKLPSACPKELIALVKECWRTNRYERPEFSTIYPRMERIVVHNMLVAFPDLLDPMTFPKPNNVRRDVIKKEQVKIKEESHSIYHSAEGHSTYHSVLGNSTYYSARDDSLCNDGASQERGRKSDVVEQVEKAKFIPPKVEPFLFDEEADPHKSMFGSSDRSFADHSMEVSKEFSFKEVACLRASTDRVNTVECCHFSSDGKLLASAGHDGRVDMWNMESLELKISHKAHSMSISDVRFSPNSTRLATSSWDGSVRVWDVDNPNSSLRTFTGHELRVASLDFHPNTEDLLCSCDTGSHIRYWSVNQGVCTRVFQGGMKQVRFQPRQGRLLAAAAQNVVSIFDVESGTCVHTLQRHKNLVYSVCWDAAGDFLASVSGDSVRVWNLGSRGAQGECVHELSRSKSKFYSAMFHPNHPSMLVIGCDKSLELWDFIEGQSMTAPAHEGMICGLASSAATGMLASTSYDKTVRLWK